MIFIGDVAIRVNPTIAIVIIPLPAIKNIAGTAR